MKWPFRRQQTDDSKLPAEIKDYYQAEKREKRSLAWLLALGTLFVTVALALGVFFGGRWVYRKIANNPSTPSAPQTTNKPAEAPQGGSQPSDGSTTSPTTPVPSNPPTATQPTPATTPRTGPDSDE